MKPLVALLMVLAVLLCPFAVDAAPLSPNLLTSAEATAIAAALGCPAEVHVVKASQTNGFFALGGDPFGGPVGPYIVIFGNASHDQDALRGILVHEIGHCRQWQRGELNQVWPWTEWGADTYAIDFAPQVGLDPVFLDTDLFDFYTGNPQSSGGGPHGDGPGRLLHIKYELTKRGYHTQGG